MSPSKCPFTPNAASSVQVEPRLVAQSAEPHSPAAGRIPWARTSTYAKSSRAWTWPAVKKDLPGR